MLLQNHWANISRYLGKGDLILCNQRFTLFPKENNGELAFKLYRITQAYYKMSGKKCLEKNPLPSSKGNGYDIMNCWWFGGCVMKDLIFTYF